MKQLYLILLFPILINAQSKEVHQSIENQKGIYEIITSGIYTYSFEHEEGVSGTELHLTYWFTHKWGGGLSYTAKFAEEEILHDIALIGSMNPAQWITLNAGINFALTAEHNEIDLGAYVETEINIRPTEWFHFGPVLGMVINKETEGTLGFHFGFEF